MGEIAILGRSGDTKIIWASENEAEVESARRTFDDLVAKGFAAFLVKGKKGDKGDRIYEFDADAERLILVPPMQGG